MARIGDGNAQADSVSPPGIYRTLTQWKAALERAECLCAEMFRLGLPSCCNAQAMNSRDTDINGKLISTADIELDKTKIKEKFNQHQQSCSGFTSAVEAFPPSKCGVKCSEDFATRASSSHKKPCCGDTSRLDGSSSSCNTAQKCLSSSTCSKGCCSDSNFLRNTHSRIPSAATDDCCSSTENPVSQPIVKTEVNRLLADSETLGRSKIPTALTDSEKGTLPQHVIAQVSGMTCTGCERKLQHALASTAGLHNVKTSIVLGRVEFDLVAGLSIADAVTSLERQTDFKCTVLQEGDHLEVQLPEGFTIQEEGKDHTVFSADAIALLRRSLFGPDLPSGVQNVEILGSKRRRQMFALTSNGSRRQINTGVNNHTAKRLRARIDYDPRVVGARDLLKKGFGSPLSLAIIDSADATNPETDHLRHTLEMTLLSAFLTIPVLVLSWAPLPPQRSTIYECVSLVLATLVQCIIAGPFYPRALRALLVSHMIETDLLIVISTTTAFAYSVVAFAFEVKGDPLPTGSFFETSTLLVTLIMCGRLASAYARQKAVASISMHRLQPSTAVLIEEGKETQIDVREFQYDDLFKVSPDSVVPTDGIITSGNTEIDESMITGEAIPVVKAPGSQVVAGSHNGHGPFVARLTKLPVDNTVSRIAKMVDQAKLAKPRIQGTADLVASYFVPFILALTAIVFAIWIAGGLALRHNSVSDAVVTAITYSLAALVVSCPCAIGLAVPLVMMVAGEVGAKHGVIFRSPEAIERARKTSHVVFDKTGTLTRGNFTIVEEIYREGDHNEAASITKQLTSNSNHPISQALSTHLKSNKSDLERLEAVSSIAGKGMQAMWKGQQIRGGSPVFVEETEDFDVQRLLSQGLTVFCLRHGSFLLAIYGLQDALRIDTVSVVSTLQARGIAISIISGDSSIAVNRLATELGVPTTQAQGLCTPEAKAAYVASLTATPPSRERKTPATTIIFCGDGTNDALALAKAGIGVYMAGGTDVAKSAADVVLTHPSLEGILALLDISEASMRRVYLNFAWSFIYNLCAILLAAGAFIKVRIPPAYAGLGEIVSVLPVVAVAMQLRWIKFHPSVGR